MAFWYTPDRHGTIADYLEHCKDEKIDFTFKGVEQYCEVVNAGFVDPWVATLRLMYSHGRTDGSYQVVDNFFLEGLSLSHHGGKEGVHNPIDILEGDDVPYFALSILNPNPIPLEERITQESLRAVASQ